MRRPEVFQLDYWKETLVLSLSLSLTHSPVPTHSAECVALFTARGERGHMGEVMAVSLAGP